MSKNIVTYLIDLCIGKISIQALISTRGDQTPGRVEKTAH